MAERTSDIQRIDTELATKASLVGGLVPTAQLGSGTANSTTFLRGDQTWDTPGGGPGATPYGTIYVMSLGYALP